MIRAAIAVVSLFLAWPCPGPPHSNQVQEEQAAAFQPVWYFAGQVRVNGKRLKRGLFEVFAPNDDLTCCGKLIKASRTDKHGHFLVEPLSAGKYFAKFKTCNSDEVVSFSIKQDYKRCNGLHLEIKILPDGKSTLQQYVDVDYDQKECSEEDAACYRK
jgi:hypothetical protein